MRKIACLTAAALGSALIAGVAPVRAAAFHAPGLTAPVRGGPSLSVKSCMDGHAPEIAHTAFTGDDISTCCQSRATTCAELLSTTRIQLPRRPART